MKKKTKRILGFALVLLYILLLVVYLSSYPVYRWVFEGYAISGGMIVSMILLVFVFLLLLGAIYGVKFIWKKKWGLGSMSFWSAIGAITLLNLAMTSLPFVVGWDSSTQYFITVREIAENGHFRSGIYPYLLELILGLIGKIIGYGRTPMLLVLMGSVLLVWGLWRWARVLGLSPFIQRLTVLALFLTPTFQFQLSKDTKLDIVLTGVLLLGLSFWYEKKHFKAATLLGIAPLIKLTAFWFWPGFVLYLLHATLAERKKKKKFPLQLKKTLISFLILAIPVGMWGSWNLIRSESTITHKNFVKQFFKSSGQRFKIIPLNKEVPQLNSEMIAPVGFAYLQIQKPEIVRVFADTVTVQNLAQSQVTQDTTPPRKSQRLKATGRIEELGRYAGASQNFFVRIHTIFTSKYISMNVRHHTDMSFLWLWGLIVSVLGFVVIIRRKNTPLEIPWIYGTLIVGVVLWIYQGEGVAWYGIPLLMGIIPLAILWTGKYFTSQRVLVGFLTIPIILGFLTWIFHYEPDYVLVSKSYWSNPTPENLREIQEQFYRQELAVTDIVNAPEHRDENIWKIASLTNAFIEGYDERVLSDSLIDRWTQFSHNKTDEKILKLLEHNNVHWFILDRSIASIEMNPDGTLHQKFENLNRFLDTYGEVHHDNRRLGLYRIRFDLVDEVSGE